MESARPLIQVDEILVAKRRRKRSNQRVVDLGVLSVAVILTAVSLASPASLDVQNPLLLGAGILTLYAIGLVAFWSDSSRLRAINAVLVTDRGFCPPFKPKQRLSKGDWFVPYKDIASMAPVAGRGASVSAYDVTLRNGLTFQVNALDILVYLGEKEVRQYAKTLALIKQEVERPENQAKAERGEDVVVPRDRFQSINETRTSW
ncbi:MAG TPA: hypothetical protein VEO96_05510 [Thermoplasmata archaeon]|nr:hypothetical protein [Thermoplasmata archaeon]